MADTPSTPAPPKRKLHRAYAPRGARSSIRVYTEITSLTRSTCPCPGPCVRCRCATTKCAALPDERMYSEYSRGPAGWSHAPSDFFEVDAPGDYNYVGCRSGVLDLGTRCVARKRFVLGHEIEHERQRAAGLLHRGGLVRVFLLESAANIAGWRTMAAGSWRRHIRWLAVLDCFANALVTAVVSWCGLVKTAVLLSLAIATLWAVLLANSEPWQWYTDSVGVAIWGLVSLAGIALLLAFVRIQPICRIVHWAYRCLVRIRGAR